MPACRNVLLMLALTFARPDASAADLPGPTIDGFDGVTWNPDCAVPSELGVLGRTQLVMLGDANAADTAGKDLAGILYEMSEWHYEAEVDVAYIPIFAKANLWKSKKDGYDTRLPDGVDDGTLLRAYGVRRTGILLVIEPDGRISRIVTKIAELDEKFYQGFKNDDAHWPVLPHENRVPQPVTKPEHDAIAWLIATDGTRMLAEIEKARNADFTKSFQKCLAAALHRTCDSYQHGDAGGKYLAITRLARLSAEFPSGMTSDATKTLTAGRADAAVKRETQAMTAFQEYVHAMRAIQGADQAAKQTALLKALIAKHAGTYAAELAEKIAETGELVPSPKK